MATLWVCVEAATARAAVPLSAPPTPTAASTPTTDPTPTAAPRRVRATPIDVMAAWRRRRRRALAYTADRPLRLDGAALRRQYADLSDALAQQPGVSVERVGGFGQGGAVRVRGAAPNQTRWAIDGVALESPIGRPFDVEQLPVGLLDALELYPDGAPLELGHETLGGAVNLRLRADGRRARVGVGRYGAAFAEGLVGWGDGLIGARVLGSRGDFSYRDDGGTAFEPSDDRILRRSNNAVFRLGGMLSERVDIGDGVLSLRWLGGYRSGGLAGAAGQPTERAQLRHHRHDVVLRLAREALDVRAHGGVLDDAVDDGGGELGVAVQRRLRLWAGELAATWRPTPIALGDDLRVAPALRAGVECGRSGGEDLRSGARTPSSTRQMGSLTLGLPVHAPRARLLVEPRLSLAGVASERAEDPAYSGAWQRRVVPLRALWTARLGARWRQSEQLAVGLSFARAARPPTLLELFGNDGSVRGNAQLRDETSLGVSLSVLASAALGPVALAARVAGGLRRQRDLIALVRSSPSSAIWINVAEADVLAGEASLSATWAGRAELSAQIDGLRAIDGGADPAYAGRDLPLLPRSQWRLRASWLDAHLGPVAARPFAALRWRASRFADRANLVTLAPRTRLDLGIGLSWRRAALDLRVDNVLDADDQDLIGFPLPRRAWLATLTWRFDAAVADTSAPAATQAPPPQGRP